MHEQDFDERQGSPPLRDWLVDDIRDAWRFWSLRLIAVAWFASAWPEGFLYLYALVPYDLQYLLPARNTVVAICLALAVIARLVKQRRARKAKQDG